MHLPKSKENLQLFDFVKDFTCPYSKKELESAYKKTIVYISIFTIIHIFTELDINIILKNRFDTFRHTRLQQQ